MAETNPPNPSKFYNHFLYKAIFVSIFLLLVPLFPSEAPNFINQTINTTSWELLQLVFVGIAVSYGLFSKRSNDEKEEVKSDNAHSYVTRLLQVSSVFDDDDESESERQRQENNNNNNSSKVETWSSQYYRGEPIVVVANETTDEAAATTTIEKPVVSVSESSSMMVSRSNSSRSRSRSRGFSEENVVLRSPIPWRSRSGRMAPSQSQSPEDSSSSDINESLSFRYQSSTNPPPLPSEIQSKDVGRKNKSAIPPPPPPPPPPAHQKLNYYSRMNKEFTRSLTNEDLLKHNRGRRETSFTSSSGGGSKSFRQTEYDEYLSHDKEIESFIQRRGSHKKEELNTETESLEMIKDSEESQEDEEDDELVELASKNNNNVVDHGPDVDKKADEFIAKFREQIRLQRIASIRRSTSQTPKT